MCLHVSLSAVHHDWRLSSPLVPKTPLHFAAGKGHVEVRYDTTLQSRSIDRVYFEGERQLHVLACCVHVLNCVLYSSSSSTMDCKTALSSSWVLDSGGSQTVLAEIVRYLLSWPRVLYSYIRNYASSVMFVTAAGRLLFECKCRWEGPCCLLCRFFYFISWYMIRFFVFSSLEERAPHLI